MMTVENVARHIQAVEQDALLEVLATEAGRATLWSILEYCAPFNDIPFGREAGLRAVGRRQVGLALMKRIHDVDIRWYRRMQDEASYRDAEYRQLERQETSQ